MEMYKGINEKGEIIWHEENRIKVVKAIVKFITELCPDLGPYHIASLSGEIQGRMESIHYEQMRKIEEKNKERKGQEKIKMMCTGGNPVLDLLDECIKNNK